MGPPSGRLVWGFSFLSQLSRIFSDLSGFGFNSVSLVSYHSSITNSVSSGGNSGENGSGSGSGSDCGSSGSGSAKD